MFFALQDEVANAVAARIEPTIQAADLRRGAARPTEDLGAYDLFLRAQQRYREFDKRASGGDRPLRTGGRARSQLRPGLVVSRPSARPHLVVGWTEHRGETLLEARDAIRHVLRTNDDDAVALACVAWAGAALEGDRRSYLGDGRPRAHAQSRLLLVLGVRRLASLWGGRYEQALERFRHSVRLNPRAPERHHALMGTGAALLLLERFEEALPGSTKPSRPGRLSHVAILPGDRAVAPRPDQDAKAALARFEALASLKDVIDMLDSPRPFCPD